MNWLLLNEIVVNQVWFFTLSAMVLLFVICTVLPDNIVGRYLPLHSAFKPQTNIDLDFQSIGYTITHTTWATRITHITIIIEAVLWFVIFESWHWAAPFLGIALIMIQVSFIGDKKFGFVFFLIGGLTYGTSIYAMQYLGKTEAILLSKFLLMLGAMLRMLSHSAAPIPPILAEPSDKFVKLSSENFSWRVLLATPIGYIGEFASGLPYRILPVQVNYICQTFFGIKPTSIKTWSVIEESAQKVLVGGYSTLASLKIYYESVMKE